MTTSTLSSGKDFNNEAQSPQYTALTPRRFDLTNRFLCKSCFMAIAGCIIKYYTINITATDKKRRPNRRQLGGLTIN